MPNLDGKTYKSSFDGFLDNLPKKKLKYATNDDNIIARVEKQIDRLEKIYLEIIMKKDKTIKSLRKQLKKEKPEKNVTIRKCGCPSNRMHTCSGFQSRRLI